MVAPSERPLANNQQYGTRHLAILCGVLVSMLCWSQPILSTNVPAQGVAVISWGGTLRNASGQPIPNALVVLTAQSREITTTSSSSGTFEFTSLNPGSYQLSVHLDGHEANYPETIEISGTTQSAVITVSDQDGLAVSTSQTQSGTTGGEQLSSKAVSELPLNKRDFSQLLLLAAGTMTDSNGANNFTQQFAINGQRGVEAVFAMDGGDITDPELGGGTFTNFNVDAVEEIRSSSGWMPAETGRGAAGFTDIITRSGSSGFHGSAFEFLRNSALDARNFFDHPSIANPGRIPPFRRNEFGLTNGGPVVIPGIYDGRGKTFYFGQYQGFRQVLGTTQVLPVPTADERAGLDTTAFPGDTLFIPVDPGIANVLARYPLPNFPSGPYGARTFATSASVRTDADQFSVRMDHKLDEKSQLFFRVNYDNLSGPTTNPDQTVIDPSFGVRYIDKQRNVAASYVRTISPRFNLKCIFGIIRTTPAFSTSNDTDAALEFNDGLFESFNTAAGSVNRVFGNLFQLTQTFAFNTSKHQWRWGGEVRLNRDTTYFGASPNGQYDFGGGVAYSPVHISSQSGTHDIHAGDPLPDTLTSFLTGSAFAYTISVAPSYFSNGEHIGPAAVNRNAVAMYVQDTWKINDRFVLDYGLRYELYSPISERAKRTSNVLTTQTATGTKQEFLINPQSPYQFNLNGFGPRVQLDWRTTESMHLHVGGAITTLPPNIWQTNLITAATPFVAYPRLTAAPGAPIQYGFQITPSELPPVYTPSGQNIFASGNTKSVPANTVMDVNRYEQDIAALSPSHRITPLDLFGIDREFGNAQLYTWMLGGERRFGNITAGMNYIGTAGVKLPRISFPNGYQGASPSFAPYTQFDSAGNVTGGFGVERIITDSSHSTYHGLHASLRGTIPHGGPGLQTSYTWSKSLDDTSTVIGGGPGTTGAVAKANPQDPFDTHPEKGPSTFDVAHVFTLSVAQDLHFDSINFLSSVSKKMTRGWELLSISTITSGLPSTVYSGVQQTGAGAGGADRPDLLGIPQLSTARPVREDYFGRGENNASFFYIPIGVAGGTGPNEGRYGTLGRNTFRGPAFYNYDFALIKDTSLGTRASGSEVMNLQFRAEFFNLFNIVDMGLPANVIRGSGFGMISKTANNSRQVQFSLKMIY
jgi:hypothetical protein